LLRSARQWERMQDPAR